MSNNPAATWGLFFKLPLLSTGNKHTKEHAGLEKSYALLVLFYLLPALLVTGAPLKAANHTPQKKAAWATRLKQQRVSDGLLAF